MVTFAESKDDPTWNTIRNMLPFVLPPGSPRSRMKVCVPGGHVPAVAAAAVHAEHNLAYTRASVHARSTAALKVRLVSTPNVSSVALWPYTATLHQERSTAEAMQAVIGTGKALPTESDKSSTCMRPCQDFRSLITLSLLLLLCDCNSRTVSSINGCSRTKHSRPLDKV
jgi:hypothetical protein